MQYFIRKSLKWLAYVVLTVLFFSLPVILRDESPEKTMPVSQSAGTETGGLLFEFLSSSAGRSVTGDSTGLRMIVKTDTSEKTVYLYVNGEKQDMIVVSDSMEIEFPRVYLRNGENEITAVLRSLHGDTLAVREMRIVSQKKL